MTTAISTFAILLAALLAVTQAATIEQRADATVSMPNPLPDDHTDSTPQCSWAGGVTGTHCAYLKGGAFTYGVEKGQGIAKCSIETGYFIKGQGTCHYKDGQTTRFYCGDKKKSYAVVSFANSCSQVTEKQGCIRYYWQSQDKNNQVVNGQGPSKQTQWPDDNFIVDCSYCNIDNLKGSN